MGSEKHLINDEIQPEYYKFKEKIFNCKKPIRFPNGYQRTKDVAFSLIIDKNGCETRLDYINARKLIYVKEYCRLIRKLDELSELKNYLVEGKALVICEIDVPNNEQITLTKLESLVNNKNIKFGHGLCLAWELLKD
jgi:hypothetical protein